MAAPLARTQLSKLKSISQIPCQINRIRNQTLSLNRLCQRSIFTSFVRPKTATKWKIGAGVAFVSSVFATKFITKSDAASEERPVSRHVKGILDIGDQKFTLYQFQSCPYCCKVRATLDFFGFPYDVVEVNSITKSQIKFSDYKKVPILVVDGNDGENDFTLQFSDSSVIMSVLASYVYDQTTTLQTIQTYYPGMKEKRGRKTVWDFPNKYFLMYGDNIADSRSEKERSSERQWRKWVDDILMHTISPNVYRTLGESLEAFRHFSDWGEWDKHFSTPTRLFVVYVGTLAMYIIGRVVKKRYNIKDNPRESLYEACDAWMAELGDQSFLGGTKPNMADLSVYGALHSFNGCEAFNDLMSFHAIRGWYDNIEAIINTHEGASQLGQKPAHHPNYIGYPHCN